MVTEASAYLRYVDGSAYGSPALGVVHAGEPFHHAAQQAVLAEYRAYVIRHGAQILADHQTVHAGRFNGQDRDHRLIVVRNVRATARAFALRNPPQTE